MSISYRRSTNFIQIMKVLYLIFLVLLVCSCKQKHKTLFQLVSPQESGIHFSNKISDSDTLNILNQEYIYNGGGVGFQ